MFKVERGNTFLPDFIFYNQVGSPFAPQSGAYMKVAYTVGSAPAVASIGLTSSGDRWCGYWDTRSVDPGLIHGTAFTVNTYLHSRVDFFIELTANSSNT